MRFPSALLQPTLPNFSCFFLRSIKAPPYQLPYPHKYYSTQAPAQPGHTRKVSIPALTPNHALAWSCLPRTGSSGKCR